MPGQLSGAGVSLSTDESAALRAGNVSKTHATLGVGTSRGGKIYSIYVGNTTAGILYFQIFKNLAASSTPPFDVPAPADGATPDMSYLVPASGVLQITWQFGDACPTSIYWCLSSTSATKTIAGSVGLVKVDFH